ncbi:hypothetical protein LUZ60_013951 [Juncus effusus]|nr:hypothetical protein LUZ60_013951 [Juncus effusus]
MADAAYERQERGLKHLNFARVAAVHAVLCLTSLYELAKDNAGPLKGGIQAAENTVKSVMSPVYDSFHDAPLVLLSFADSKVDYALAKLKSYVPPTMKSVTCHSINGAKNISMALREILSDIHKSGISNGLKAAYERYEPAAQDLYKQYEPVAEQYAVTIWQRLNRLPVFPHVAHMLVPTAAYWAEKYNIILEHANAHEFRIASYLPEIPIEKIAKVFNGADGDAGAEDEGASSSSSSEDEVATSEVPLDRSETVFADVADSPDLASE